MEDWHKGEKNGNIGWFPKAYVERVDGPSTDLFEYLHFLFLLKYLKIGLHVLLKFVKSCHLPLITFDVVG